MTWTTILLIWMLLGIVGFIWHTAETWCQHKMWESTAGEIMLFTAIDFVVGLLLGPIGIAIKIWEKWFDPSNI